MRELKKSKILSIIIHLLAAATLILVCTKISFLFKPVGIFISTLFAPIIIAGFLYYVMNPVVGLLEKFTKKRSRAILIVFILIALGFVFFIGIIIPNLLSEVTQLASSMPRFMREQQMAVTELLNRPELSNVDIQRYWNELNISTGRVINGIVNGFTTSIGSVISVLSSSIILMVTVPVILFYMFKDGEQLPSAIRWFIPEKQQKNAEELIQTVNKTLSSYISGQALVCLYVGTGAYITFKLLGIPYAFLLACIAGMMDIIPYIGPWIGVAPAFIIAFANSPQSALILALSIVVIQLGESYLVYPLIMGKSLNMHPLTIILILLVAGNLAGLVGMILALPTYAVVKIIVLSVAKIFKLGKYKEKIVEESI